MRSDAPLFSQPSRRRSARPFLLTALACLLAALVLRPAPAGAAATLNLATAQDGQRVVLTYDLASTTPTAHVGLLLRLGEKLLDPRALHLSGDLGTVTAGPGKRIVWEAGEDFPGGLAGAVDGELVAVELQPEPVSGLTFIPLDGRCFDMGCGPWNPVCEPDEQPVFPACPGAYAISTTPVNNAAFAAFLNATGRGGDFPGLSHADGSYAPLPDAATAPASGVSREDARAYAAWLSAKTGAHYALPSEAQWENACRSGGRLFPFSTPDGRMSGNLEAPVQASSGPNLLGLENMSGGVWEWTDDTYAPYPLHAGQQAEGPGVLRGGRLGSPLRNARCVNRYERDAQARDPSSGFRLVRLQ
ncbi:Sulphatase-modifying factor protein [Desulfovibrio sp. X2]|uniref:formylglycine-generating enzyme family protein n=1 Tax=Desulfovibrio sp. X2 TaxID=941449 RepID=UPI000358AC40|nr:formylglycine-generating enzyme family protein [Desulfovibrio sp. X2]EPR44686.1 Sulphatase-modifying factor protein [Desulfovibrio sp. X2]